MIIIPFGFLAGEAIEPTVFTKRVAVSGDDGRTFPPTNFSNSGTNIPLGHNGGAAFDSFYRFPDVTIPQDATIISAKITFVAFNDQSNNTMRNNIYCNDIDDAVAPTTGAGHNALARTTSFSAWDGEESWTENVTYETPDFRAAVQEVVSRGSWSSGNALMVLIDDDGSDSGAARLVDTQDLGETTGALLTVTYR